MKHGKELATIAVILGIFVLAFVYERAMWNECRATNSWFYCMRTLYH
jgi:hypothetical protein